MKRIAISLLVALLLIGGLCFVGCETESASENNVDITPASATILIDESVELTASGGYDYEWSIETDAWGTLSTTEGNTTVYTSAYDPAAETWQEHQVITVTSYINGQGGGTNGLGDYSQTAEAVITHQSAQVIVLVSPPSAQVAAYGSVSFTASGANIYTWSMQNPTYGHLTATEGSATTYTSTLDADEEFLQILTCTTDRGTVTVHIIHSPDATSVTISPASANITDLESVTFTASGASFYEWSLANPDWGTLSTDEGPVTTYTSDDNDFDTERVQTLTCDTDEGTVSVSIIHDPGELTISPSFASIEPGESQNFTATGGDGTYDWDLSAGAQATLDPNSTRVTTVTVFNSASNSFTVVVESDGNTASASVEIDI